jgi:hypothetical protein
VARTRGSRGPCGGAAGQAAGERKPSGRAVLWLARSGAWRSLVSALVWGTRGPRFKSGRPDHRKAPQTRGFLRLSPPPPGRYGARMAALRPRTATGRASRGDRSARKALIRRRCLREARCAANPHEPGNAADHLGAYEVTNAAGHFGKYVIGAGTGSEHWCRRPGLRGSPIRRGLSLASHGYCGVGCGRRVKTGTAEP